jgi:hypothetical protein
VRAAGKVRQAATGKAMGKAATGRTGETRERECGSRKHGTADGSAGRKNEDRSTQHDKLLCRHWLDFHETIPFRLVPERIREVAAGTADNLSMPFRRFQPMAQVTIGRYLHSVVKTTE